MGTTTLNSGEPIDLEKVKQILFEQNFTPETLAQLLGAELVEIELGETEKLLARIDDKRISVSEGACGAIDIGEVDVSELIPEDEQKHKRDDVLNDLVACGHLELSEDGRYVIRPAGDREIDMIYQVRLQTEKLLISEVMNGENKQKMLVINSMMDVHNQMNRLLGNASSATNFPDIRNQFFDLDIEFHLCWAVASPVGRELLGSVLSTLRKFVRAEIGRLSPKDQLQILKSMYSGLETIIDVISGSGSIEEIQMVVEEHIALSRYLGINHNSEVEGDFQETLPGNEYGSLPDRAGENDLDSTNGICADTTHEEVRIFPAKDGEMDAIYERLTKLQTSLEGNSFGYAPQGSFWDVLEFEEHIPVSRPENIKDAETYNSHLVKLDELLATWVTTGDRHCFGAGVMAIRMVIEKKLDSLNENDEMYKGLRSTESLIIAVRNLVRIISLRRQNESQGTSNSSESKNTTDFDFIL